MAAGEDGPRRWEAEARVLARQNDEEIAARCGITAGAVHRFERLAFLSRREV